MNRELGPQSRRVYMLLHDRIARGEYVPGSALPSYNKLAAEFGVSAVTVRQVLARLDEQGLVSRRQGSGTYVQRRERPGVLIVDDDQEMRTLLSLHAAEAGHRVVEAASPAEALAILEADHAIGLVLSDVRMPDRATGAGFIRTVQHRWPGLPLAAITGYPDDLAELHGTPECPVLILAKPVREHQLREVFRWVLGRRAQV